jgi:hypothetical protein
MLGWISVALLLAPTMANATSESFQYFSASAGNISADFTVDVTGGVAQDGTGSFSSATLGNFGLTLLTASSVLPGGNGSINPTPGSPSYDLGSGFTWQAVTGSGGANFSGDAVVNSTPNYLDDYGLIFAVTDKSTGNIVGGLNIWANTNTPGSLYATELSVNGTNVFENSGNGSITAVPEPRAYGLALAGLGVVGMLGSRRRRAS